MFSDRATQKRYECLQRDKNKAKRKSEYGKAAELCNCIGEMLAEEGVFFSTPWDHSEL